MVVAVHLFLLQKQKVLLARRFNTGYEDGKFSLPAGHVEANESCLAAMVREAKEEINILIQPHDLQLAHVMHRTTDRESIDFFFSCKIWEGQPEINEKEKCDCLQWSDPQKLPTNTIPYIRQAITLFQQGQPYSQMGWEGEAKKLS